MHRDISVSGSMKPALRTDIQALRGWAVLLVVAYHAGAPVHGYLGVDVFFVISGFLITSVIRKGIENDDFSFSAFYYRRVKRLLPAAYCVIAATIIAAPYFLNDLEIQEMRAQVIGAVTFTANFVLWTQTDYFAGAAETKPLLHFWSLAIEEQYYLFMPIFLFLVSKRFWFPAITSIILFSFLSSLYYSFVDPSLAFYFPHTRAWELAIGSMGALLPGLVLGHRLLSALRIPAIGVLLTIPLYPIGLPHPGADAAMVCLATLILILVHDRSPWERTVPVRVLAKVGDFSYSLYLVHWPILVFNRAAWIEGAPAYSLILCVVISVILSALLYRWVELPFHKGFSFRPARLVSTLILTSAALIAAPNLIGAMTSTQDFEHVRRTNYGLGIDCAFSDRRPFEGTLPDVCRTKPASRVLVVGDSYAMAWASALMNPLAAYGLEQASMGACDPLRGMARYPRNFSNSYNQSTAERCLNFQLKVLEYVRKNPDIEIVVVAARFQTVLSNSNVMLVSHDGTLETQEVSTELVVEGIRSYIDDIRSSGRKVVVLAPPPANGSKIGDCVERRAKSQVTFGGSADCSMSLSSVLAYRKDVSEMLALASLVANVDVIDPTSFFCDTHVCRVEIDDVPIYRDEGHLSVEGAQLIGMQSDLGRQVVQRAR